MPFRRITKSELVRWNDKQYTGWSYYHNYPNPNLIYKFYLTSNYSSLGFFVLTTPLVLYCYMETGHLDHEKIRKFGVTTLYDFEQHAHSLVVFSRSEDQLYCYLQLNFSGNVVMFGTQYSDFYIDTEIPSST